MRYRKIDPRFWKDEKVRRLEFTDKLIALYLFTGQSNRIGIFTFSVGMGAEDTGLPVETFAKRCRNVCQALNWAWDEQAGVMYLPTWWKYDQPPNPNNVVGCLTDLGDVPNSPLVAHFCANIEHLKPNLASTFTETLAQHYPKRVGTPEPLPLPLPLPEPLPEPESETKTRSRKARACVPQQPGLIGAGSNGRPRGVEDFLAVYPNKRALEYARKAWKKLNPDSVLIEQIFSAVEAQKGSPEWLKDDGRYIPLPASWLNGRRWEDERRPASSSVFTDVTQRNIRAAQNVLDRMEEHRG